MNAIDLSQPVTVAPPPLDRWARLESALEAMERRLDRMGDPDWLSFADACERLMGCSLDAEHEDGVSFDGAYDAYCAGLTPAHYAYAIGRIDPALLSSRPDGAWLSDGHAPAFSGPPPPAYAARVACGSALAATLITAVLVTLMFATALAAGRTPLIAPALAAGDMAPGETWLTKGHLPCALGGSS